MAKPDHGTAFPIVIPGFVYPDGSSRESYVLESGISVRDYFAGQALSGRIVNYMPHGSAPPGADELPTLYAANAYAIADAMLKEREK